MSDHMILNAVVASDKTNGIGFTEAQYGNANVSLPWKLDGEFKYFMDVCTYNKEELAKEGKKHVFVCGPKVFEEHYPLTPQPGFIYVIVSKSMKTKPANCDILTADYSFKEMMDILSGDEYKGKIGNIIVLGGVPLYNTMMAKDFKYKSRFLWSRIDADCVADRKIENLDMNIWKENSSRNLPGFPELPSTVTEVNHVTGETVSWYVHCYENF